MIICLEHAYFDSRAILRNPPKNHDHNFDGKSRMRPSTATASISTRAFWNIRGNYAEIQRPQAQKVWIKYNG